MRNLSIQMLVFSAMFFAALSSISQTLKAEKESAPFQLLKEKEKPFWKTKKKVRKRLKKRELFVSVTSDEREIKGQKDLQQLFMKGVGWVEAPFASVKKKIHDYPQLKTLAPKHFKEIRHDVKNNRLYVHGVAMGWHARMHMQLHSEDISDKIYRLHWHVIQGSFKGLTGYFELDSEAVDLERRKVEFSMTAFYESEKLPLPTLLLSFGLETVLRVVAQRMRTFLEESAPIPEKKN